MRGLLFWLIALPALAVAGAAAACEGIGCRGMNPVYDYNPQLAPPGYTGSACGGGCNAPPPCGGPCRQPCQDPCSAGPISYSVPPGYNGPPIQVTVDENWPGAGGVPQSYTIAPQGGGYADGYGQDYAPAEPSPYGYGSPCGGCQPPAPPPPPPCRRYDAYGQPGRCGDGVHLPGGFFHGSGGVGPAYVEGGGGGGRVIVYGGARTSAFASASAYASARASLHVGGGGKGGHHGGGGCCH